jgi:hypothetical protein
MSGALIAFDVGLQAVNVVGILDFGALGPVVLGDFVFTGFEVPPHVTFGGKQAMTVHRLPGGERVVDLLGPDDHYLQWSGAFLNQFPSQSVQRLDQMRVDGNPLPLTWGNYYYTVLIDDFAADDRTSGPLQYRISCLVLGSGPSAPTAQQPSLTGAVNNDVNSSAASLNTAPANG